MSRVNVFRDHQLDFERLAELRRRMQELANELSYDVADVDVHEDVTDEGHWPYLTIELKQRPRRA